jgi:hypothetical protein
MLLAATGLLCGIIGTVIWLNPAWLEISGMQRLAGLLCGLVVAARCDSMDAVAFGSVFQKGLQ